MILPQRGESFFCTAGVSPQLGVKLVVDGFLQAACEVELPNPAHPIGARSSVVVVSDPLGHLVSCRSQEPANAPVVVPLNSGADYQGQVVVHVLLQRAWRHALWNAGPLVWVAKLSDALNTTRLCRSQEQGGF